MKFFFCSVAEFAGLSTLRIIRTGERGAGYKAGRGYPVVWCISRPRNFSFRGQSIIFFEQMWLKFIKSIVKGCFLHTVPFSSKAFFIIPVTLHSGFLS